MFWSSSSRTHSRRPLRSKTSTCRWPRETSLWLQRALPMSRGPPVRFLFGYTRTGHSSPAFAASNRTYFFSSPKATLHHQRYLFEVKHYHVMAGVVEDPIPSPGSTNLDRK